MKWLSANGITAVHKRQAAEHGDRGLIRDRRQLEVALAYAKKIAATQSRSDIPRVAAAYAFGIAKYHPFVDGNNRTALIACRTFLILNGVQLVATRTEKFLTFLSLADGSLSEEELTTWLSEKMVGP